MVAYTASKPTHFNLRDFREHFKGVDNAKSNIYKTKVNKRHNISIFHTFN